MKFVCDRSELHGTMDITVINSI